MIDPDLLEPHRAELWALCYRVTGVAADADECVQDTFLRATERPPDLTRPLRPWLRKVAVNLARDRTRRRRRRAHIGPWLPTPYDVDAVACALPDPEGRVGLAESLSYGFLVALEALTPQQRAVLLLRDVVDLDVAETAETLEMSASNIKVTLHRARRRLAAWEARRRPIDAAHRAAVTARLGELFALLGAGDLEGATALFSDDALALTDGGGEVHAARVPLIGAARIARVYGVLATKVELLHVALQSLNGLPAAVGRTRGRPGEPWGFVHQIELAADGRVARLYSMVAPSRLRELGMYPPA